MPRISRVTTRTGDDGTTGLGGGQRIPKDAPRIAALGAVDELSSAVGLALAAGVTPATGQRLRAVQNDLFHLGADLCVLEAEKASRPGPRIDPRHVQALDGVIEELTNTLPALENFVLPGGAPAAAALHMARALCRRAERAVVALSRAEAIGPQIVLYLNRLSDALFLLARQENRAAGEPDVVWDSRA